MPFLPDNLPCHTYFAHPDVPHTYRCLLFQHFQNLRQILRIQKRHPVDRTHRGTYCLGVVDIHTVMAQNDAVHTCPLCRAENSPHIARILKVLQQQQQRILFLQKILLRVMKLPDQTKDPPAV